MEVSIGVQNVARDVSFETEATPEEVTAAVEQALAAPDSVLALTDDRGRKILVPGRAIGWVVVGEGEKSRVGFGMS